MKKIFKKVWFWVGIIVLIAIIASGFYLVKGKQMLNKDVEKKQSTGTGENVSTEKTDAGVTEETVNPDEGKPTPEVNTGLSELSGVTLTAYLIKEATTSVDGKTTIPANSIQPYFYPQGAGVYSIQKFSGSSWIDVASNVSYPGHGGIAGAFTGSTEDNISYRVVKIENNKAAAVSKTFTILRSDLASGVKTYN